eukprot:11981879-Alexandrium_andersonii.AAC.1
MHLIVNDRRGRMGASDFHPSWAGAGWPPPLHKGEGPTRPAWKNGASHAGVEMRRALGGAAGLAAWLRVRSAGAIIRSQGAATSPR